MPWAIISNNIVQNIIMYDRNSNFVPPQGTTVQEINSWISIGDDKDLPEPVPPTPEPDLGN